MKTGSQYKVTKKPTYVQAPVHTRLNACNTYKELKSGPGHTTTI